MVIPHRVGRERDVVLGVTPRAAENGDGQDRYNDGKTPPSITGARAECEDQTGVHRISPILCGEVPPDRPIYAQIAGTTGTTWDHHPF